VPNGANLLTSEKNLPLINPSQISPSDQLRDITGLSTFVDDAELLAPRLMKPGSHFRLLDVPARPEVRRVVHNVLKIRFDGTIWWQSQRVATVWAEHDPLTRRVFDQNAGDDFTEYQGTQAPVHQLLIGACPVQSQIVLLSHRLVQCARSGLE